MPILADLFQVAIVILSLIGLSLAGRLVLPSVDYALHFCFTPLIVVATLFCLEHFFPLGQAHFLWLPGCVLSLLLIKRFGPRELLQEKVLWYFLFGFGVCFFWRYSFPDLHINSERIADHDHLVSYAAGGLLPAEDIWLKGNPDNMYYIFQYYAGGLIHRWTGTGSGMTYQLAYCVLSGLAVAGVGAGVRAITQSTWAGSWASLGLALGGSGTTLVSPFMLKWPGITSAAGTMRFIGSFAMPGNIGLNSFGQDFVRFIGPSPVDCPMEYYSYVMMLGDYHPSLSSLLFFGLGIAAIGVAERAPAGSLTDRYALMAAVSTAVFLFISNTWIAPLQVGLIVGWLIYRRWCGKKDTFLQILLAWLVPFALIFPFFSQFAYETRNYGVHIRWVEQRTPLLDWILVMGPGMLMWLCSLLAGFRSRLGIFVSVMGAGATIGTYFFYVDDMYGGQFAIFNTTLKWWPWAYALCLSLGLAVCWSSLLYRRLAVVITLLTLPGNLVVFGNEWALDPKEHFGRLDGYAWFTEVPEQQSIIKVLESLPKGVVLESVPPNAGGPCITTAQFSGHYSVGGWIGHEMLWRGNRLDLVAIGNGRDDFYNGKLKDPLPWLSSVLPGGVDYIVWLGYDNEHAKWSDINDSIKSAYDWKEVYRLGDTYWGIWIRRK